MTVPPAPWPEFPVDQVPRPIVLLDIPVHIGDRGFVDGEAKQAWLTAAVDTAVALPDGLLDLVRGGRPGRPADRPLLVSAVEPVPDTFWCDRGPRVLPAYRLTISGLRQPCLVLDPALEIWWPPPEQRSGAVARRDRATVEDDGTTVHLPVFGGVRTEFHRAEFTEYDTCVVGRAITSERPARPGAAEPLVLIGATVTGRLRSPLGGRVLLHEGGGPVAVVGPAAAGPPADGPTDDGPTPVARTPE